MIRNSHANIGTRKLSVQGLFTSHVAKNKRVARRTLGKRFQELGMRLPAEKGNARLL
jgi:hypothetical protein